MTGAHHTPKRFPCASPHRCPLQSDGGGSTGGDGSGGSNTGNGTGGNNEEPTLDGATDLGEQQSAPLDETGSRTDDGGRRNGGDGGAGGGRG